MTRYFGGRLLSQRVENGITLSEVQYEQVRKCPWHAHGQAFFSLLLEGSYSTTSRDERLSPSVFDLCFQDGAIEHTDEIAAVRTRFLLIELAPRWVERLLEYEPKATMKPLICGPRSSWLATRLYRDYRNRALDCPLIVEGVVLEMLGDLADRRERSSTERPRWLNSVVEILDSEFGRRLTLEEIAREVGKNPVHVSRTFRRFFGEGPGDYLARLRVRFARERLSRSEAPLSEIAFLSGFSDQSHFTRVFKHHTGMTPGSFRRVAGGRKSVER